MRILPVNLVLVLSISDISSCSMSPSDLSHCSGFEHVLCRQDNVCKLTSKHLWDLRHVHVWQPLGNMLISMGLSRFGTRIVCSLISWLRSLVIGTFSCGSSGEVCQCVLASKWFTWIGAHNDQIWLHMDYGNDFEQCLNRIQLYIIHFELSHLFTWISANNDQISLLGIMEVHLINFRTDF